MTRLQALFVLKAPDFGESKIYTFPRYPFFPSILSPGWDLGAAALAVWAHAAELHQDGDEDGGEDHGDQDRHDDVHHHALAGVLPAIWGKISVKSVPLLAHSDEMLVGKLIITGGIL